MIRFSFEESIQPPTPPEGFDLDECSLGFEGKYTPPDKEAFSISGLRMKVQDMLNEQTVLTWFALRQGKDESTGDVWCESMKTVYDPAAKAWSEWEQS